MKLKDARKRRHKSQAEVAKAVNITVRTYQYIETGSQNPTMNVGLKICKFLKVSPFYIDEWDSDLTEVNDLDEDSE